MTNITRRSISILLSCFLLLWSVCLEAQNDPDKEWTLEECLEWGLKNHPGIRQAQGNIKTSMARKTSSIIANRVTVSAQAGYHRRGQDYSRLGGIRDAIADSTSESISVRKVINDFGRMDSRVRSLDSSIGAAKASEQWERVSVAAEIKIAYLRTISAKAMLDVQQENLERFQAHLKKVESFVEVGTKPPYDITKGKLDVADAQVSLIRAERDFEDSLSNLSSAVGFYGRIKPSGTNAQVQTIPEMPFEPNALTVEMASRTDLLAMHLQLESAKHQLSLVRKGRKPTLSGSADYNWSGSASPLDRSWSMGLSLSVPVFDAGETRAQIESNLGDLQIVQARLDQLKLNAKSELEKVLTAFREAGKRYEATEIQVRQAAENLNLAEARYDAGLGSPIELTDARVGFTSAKSNNISAYYDCLIAAANIDRVLGRMPGETDGIVDSEFEAVTGDEKTTEGQTK